MTETLKVGERHSVLRDAIYDALKSTKSHPCAEWVYETVRQQLPVGIATVYRNLKQLEQAGLIVAIENTHGSVHYDADVSTHGHFVCENCGKIIDVDIPTTPTNVVSERGFEIRRRKTILYGRCPDCNKNC